MKTINAFTIHVNADYPEHVDFAFQLAFEYRQAFKRDVMVDVTGFRRMGHNEHDNPQFTQPKVYEKVASHPNLFQTYSQRLIEEGSFTQEEIDAIYRDYAQKLAEAYESAKTKPVVEREREPTIWKKYLGSWKDCKQPAGPPTNISPQTFRELGSLINTLPKDKHVHDIAAKVYAARLKAIESGQGLDWGTAEALAFGSLLNQGYGVRLSGEDVRRGTFSHRHAVLVDQKTHEHFYPLDAAVKDRQSPFRFQAYNSFLSEYGVMGFDYGYSIGNPDYLTIWEAQFGDFSNVGQTITDVYLANSEVKWGLKSGLVYLLPHGLDGQGPEHSSSRVERYLQMVDDDIYDKDFIADDDRQLRFCNFAICNPSEPANYFHLLRRQMLRDYRKPLVVLAPKRLLRLKEVASDQRGAQRHARLHGGGPVQVGAAGRGA